jgi:hypothetical protein
MALYAPALPLRTRYINRGTVQRTEHAGLSGNASTRYSGGAVFESRPDADSPDWIPLWSYSVSPGVCQDSASN